MKPYTIVNVEQRSPEWFAARLGRITGTCADAMLAAGRAKGSESVQRRDLKLRLVCERITGQPQDDDDRRTTAAMDRGVEREPDAFYAYEAHTRSLVRRTGFIAHNELEIGCSLDGDIDDCTGILELKCPKTATHLRYLRGDGVPLDYMRQITHNLFVTGAEWCDFVSFDDRLGDNLALVVRRVYRTDLDMAAYELALRLFLREVEQEYRDVMALRMPQEATDVPA